MSFVFSSEQKPPAMNHSVFHLFDISRLLFMIHPAPFPPRLTTSTSYYSLLLLLLLSIPFVYIFLILFSTPHIGDPLCPSPGPRPGVQVLGHQVSEQHLPDVALIGEHGDITELGRLVQLVLGCAVSCEKKQGERAGSREGSPP